MRKGSITIAAVAVAAALGAGAGAASAAPPALPDASLFCEGVTIGPDEWVINPNSGTLWITADPLAGHYLILVSAHYRVEGLFDVPPGSYEGLLFLDAREIGHKTGVLNNALECDFVSRWDLPDPEQDFSIVGPITISKVSG